MTPRRRDRTREMPTLADVPAEKRAGLLALAKAQRPDSGESVLELAQRAHREGTAMVHKGTPSDRLQRRLAIDAPATDAAALNAQRGSSRARTGRAWQNEIAATLDVMKTQRLGFVQRHEPEYGSRPKDGGGWEWFPKKGGAPCDYSGFVTLHGDAIPVVFDVKVLPVSAATYEHEDKRRHQLLTLRDAHRCGACAFLFVYVPRIAAAVVIGPKHFEPLLRGGIPVVEAIPGHDALAAALRDAGQSAPLPLKHRPAVIEPGTIVETVPVGDAATSVPARLRLPAVPYAPPLGWDFRPGLPYAR